MEVMDDDIPWKVAELFREKLHNMEFIEQQIIDLKRKKICLRRRR